MGLRLVLNQAFYLGRMTAYSVDIGPGFYVKAQQRLGVGRAQVKPPGRKFEADPVGAVYLWVLRRCRSGGSITSPALAILANHPSKVRPALRLTAMFLSGFLFCLEQLQGVFSCFPFLQKQCGCLCPS